VAALPEPSSPTIDAIYASYETRAAQERRRGYLGGSEIGRACARQVWYRFRWALRVAFDGRMLRLFNTGHREEPRLLDELRRIGIQALDVDPETKRQWRFTAHGGHLSGSLDAVVLGILEAPKTWHLAEFKTANTKKFTALKKDGVERVEPVHFAQMQMYMGLAELTRAAYFVVCKENDSLYFERVKFDQAVFERLLERARQIITSAEPLTKYSADPFSPPCCFCEQLPICHEEQVPEVNCRTCAYSTPVLEEGDSARWRCERHDRDLSLQDQERGCDEHLFIPALIPYAEPVDAGDGFVLYQLRKKDQRFANVAASSFPALDVPHFSSEQLRGESKEKVGGTP
jgi:hypothetical protein